MTATNRILALAFGALVLGASAPAMAAMAPLQADSGSMPKGASRDRYRKGKEAHDQGRYEDAGREWAAVLDMVPETGKNRSLRSRIILDVMAAYKAAYQETGDVALLEAGLDHYFRYFQVYKETYNSPRIPRPVVEARYDLKAMIDESKRNSSANAGGGNDPSNGSGHSGTEDSNGGSDAPTDHSSAQDQGGVPADNDSSKGERMNVSVSGGGPNDRSGTPLIAAGAAVLALGVGASSMIAVGAIEGQRAREDQKLPGFTDEQRARIDKRGRSMNALLIAGAVVTPVLIGTGAALIGVGVKRRKDRKLQAVVPKVNRTFVGVTIKGRF